MARYALTLIAFSAAISAGEGSLSVMPLDDVSRELQYKANDLYESGKYERAMFIYKNDLATVGDKYAQYMVGYMYEKGSGVPANAVAASAWYRIAASGRGRSEFAEAAEASVRSMSPEERELADGKYIELKKKYSDVAVVFRQVQKDMAWLKQAELLAGVSRSISPSGTDAGVALKLAEKRLEWGLDYLADELKKPEYDVAFAEVDIVGLAEDVDAWTSQLD